MRKFNILLALGWCSFFMSCNGGENTPDIASEVSGAYTMTYYELPKGPVEGDLSSNEIEVFKVQNDVVTIVIDFANPDALDVVNEGVVIIKKGDNYEFARSYASVQVSGTIKENEIDYTVLYTDGEFAKIKGEK